MRSINQNVRYYLNTTGRARMSDSKYGMVVANIFAAILSLCNNNNSNNNNNLNPIITRRRRRRIVAEPHMLQRHT